MDVDSCSILGAQGFFFVTQPKSAVHLLRMGWRNFFPVVLLCQFFCFWREIGFGVTYLHIYTINDLKAVGVGVGVVGVGVYHN